jgi:hypothetical protein
MLIGRTASITTGTGSSTGNGYRLALQQLLEADDNTVEFVGSQTRGSMAKNHFEAYSGAVISALTQPAQQNVPVSDFHFHFDCRRHCAALYCPRPLSHHSTQGTR